MQIRERGNRIEFLRCEYVSERRRSTQRLIGSQGRYDGDRLDSRLYEKMSEEEIEQAESWFKETREKFEERSRSYNVRCADFLLAELAKSVEDSPELVDESVAGGIFRGVDQVVRSLRKAGYKRKHGGTDKGKRGV